MGILLDTDALHAAHFIQASWVWSFLEVRLVNHFFFISHDPASVSHPGHTHSSTASIPGSTLPRCWQYRGAGFHLDTRGRIVSPWPKHLEKHLKGVLLNVSFSCVYFH